jgi:ASC-1-like (ASCH) protein
VGYDRIRTIKAGERIRLASRDDSQVVLVRGVRTYSAIDEMAKVEDLGHVVPGQSPPAVLKILKAIYPSDKERLGVVVLTAEPA